MPTKIDPYERASRYVTLTAFAFAIVVYFAAPISALSWRQLPFPGFLVEHTLVVNSRQGPGWSGRDQGLSPPQSVVRYGSIPVSAPSEYHSAVERTQVGESVAVFVQEPTGEIRLYPSIALRPFPNRDFVAMFWLPYLIGLAYLVIGGWIYWASGSTRPGRALSFFCICVSLGTGLLFDVLTTHIATSLWIAAVALLGGAVITLAMRFPVEWYPVVHRPWLLGVPYLPSIGLGLWGIWSLSRLDNPWLYLDARGTIYRFTAAACVAFLVVMFHRARSAPSSNIRRQARVVLVGSFLAFMPVVIWFLAPLFGQDLPFNSALLLPGLVVFPMSVATAILRYRLLEIDRLVNRALVYAGLTAVLAGVFAATIGFSQRIFVALTGETSDAAIVLTTLVVVSLVTPIRNRIQAGVDRQFRELPATELRSFGRQVRSYIELNDPTLLSRRLLEEAVEALEAESGAVVSLENGTPELVCSVGPWRGRALVSVPLVFDGQRHGLLMLGPRRRNRPYGRSEVDALAQVSSQVAHAMNFADSVAAVDASVGG